jgi:hypothetical protein
MLLGGQTAALVNIPLGVGSGAQSYWAIEVGSATPNSSGSITVNFGSSGFSGQPFVFPIVLRNATNQRPFAWLSSQPTPTSAVFGAWDQTTNSAYTQGTLYYVSLGTRAL